MPWTKEYEKEYQRQYREKNRDSLKIKKSAWQKADLLAHPEKYKAKQIEYEKNNPVKVATRHQLYRKSHKKERSEYNKIFLANNLGYMTEYAKKRQLKDPTFRLKYLLRRRLQGALKINSKRGSAVKLLGCSIEYLKQHIEKLFKPGMSWKIRGQWHLDHILPLASFDLTDPRQLEKACHYSNLQPLWPGENISKGDKINGKRRNRKAKTRHEYDKPDQICQQ